MTIDIDAIRQREQAATPGPWTADGWEIYEHPTRNWVAETLDTDDHDRSIADAEFIAHARQDIPALLAELAAARKERDENADDCTKLGVALIDLQRKLADQEQVIEAARRWAERFAHPLKGHLGMAEVYLLDAVRALPKKAEVA